jgi:hypothetical protein
MSNDYFFFSYYRFNRVRWFYFLFSFLQHAALAFIAAEEDLSIESEDRASRTFEKTSRTR